jgi:hypothetical protein
MRKKEKKITVEESNPRSGAAGPDDNLLVHWHTFFERENASGHQSFQEWLGLPEERKEQVRARKGESRK